MEGANSSTERIRVSKVVAASRDRVFKAWTDPAHIINWWSLGEGWKTVSVQIDLKVGGKISLGNQPTAGGVMEISGEFLAVQPPSKLVYTLRFPGSQPVESVVTVEFNELGEQTEVVITNDMPASMGPAALAGWKAALEKLSTIV